VKKLERIEVRLFYERSTKNTHVYSPSNVAQSDMPSADPIRSLYIQKNAMRQAVPQIKVTVEEV